MARRTWLVLLAALAALAAGVVAVRSGGTSHRPVARPTATRSPAPAVPGGWVAAENARPGTTAWRIPAADVATDAELSAYADRASAVPGEPVRLLVSASTPSVSVDAYRVGWYGGKRGRLVWHRAGVVTHRQPPPVTDPATRMVHAPWSPTLTLPTRDWPEGLYLVVLTGAHGHRRYVPLVLRSASTRDRVVLVSATLTDEAYNTWGGRSLYGGGPKATVFGQRSYAVSMDRPYDGSGIRKLSQYELGPVAVAESTGVDLAYLTSADLERPHALDGARGVVSMGHDEYWTAGMRAAVMGARDHGTNVAFLGANASYWRVRLEASPLGPDRVVVGYKSAALDPLARRDPGQATTTWRSGPRSEPESALTGMLYECYPARGDLVVTAPGFPLFAGTGVRAGSRIPGLVGAEIDRVYPLAGTPRPMELLAHSPVRCGPRGPTYSDAVYFTSPSGAGTFSTGTMSWATALSGPKPAFGITDATVRFAVTVTRNLLRAMAAGPMGRAIPATDTVGRYRLDPSTATGTGGPVG